MKPSDLVLLAYLFLLVPAMLVGFGFARRRLFVPHHKLTMTTITIINWVLIVWLMAVTYRTNIEPQVPAHLNFSYVFIPTLHALFGLTAQVIATYLVIRMWFEKQLPDWFKVKNIKRYMRTTLGLWLATALLGLTVWLVFYRNFLISPPAEAATETTGSNPTPAATRDATSAAPAATKDATSAPAQTKDATSAPAATKDALTVPTAAPARTQDATQQVTPQTTQQATQPATGRATVRATSTPRGMPTVLPSNVVTLSLTDSALKITEMTISAGTTIRFVNDGKRDQTLNAGSTFETNTLKTGDTFRFTFQRPGDITITLNGAPGGTAAATQAATQAANGSGSVLLVHVLTGVPAATREATPASTRDATNTAAARLAQTKDAASTAAAPAQTKEVK